MSYAGSTNQLRSQLCAMYYSAMVSGVVTVQFGDGGHNPDGTAKSFDPAQTALLHTLITKSVTEITMPTLYSIAVTGKLLMSELVGETLSEFGVFFDGDMIALRNSSAKIKDADEEFPITMTITF